MRLPIHLFLSPGTSRCGGMTRHDANRIGGQAGPALMGANALIPAGAVATFTMVATIQSGADAITKRERGTLVSWSS